jgi:ubiquinone biosynthesis protein
LTRNFNLKGGFEEFARYTLQELDFRNEAKTMLEFRENFVDWPDVVIPKPYGPMVTERVLTMDRISGRRVDVAAKRLAAPERLAFGRRLMELEMKMFISDGLFHADLHPGNIFFTDDRRIVLLDFGMYGRLTESHRDHFILYWLYALQRNTRGAFRHLLAQTHRQPWANEKAYYTRFRSFAERFYRSTITEYSLTQTYLQIISAGATYGFIFPSDLLLQAKALTTAEALAFVLTPELRFEDEAQPIIAREFVKRALDPERIGRLARETLPELLLFGRLPDGENLDEDTAAAPALWGQVLPATWDILQNTESAIGLVRAIVDISARPVLKKRFGSKAGDVLDAIWTVAGAEWKSAPQQSTLGASVTVRLACITIAAYRVLVTHVETSQEATQIVYDIAWDVYRKMGSLAWSIAGALATDDAGRMRIATKMFRTFPFSAPSYGWQDVATSGEAVAFDCVRCPVAEHFKAQGLSDLCVQTWCALDFPLAEHWHGRLERTSSIAAGAKRCDFRWHTAPKQ